MRYSKAEFDYQSVLEACGIQDVNMKNAFDQKNESDIKFHEEFKNFSQLSKERDEKIEKLSRIKLLHEKNLRKLSKTNNKIVALNKELKMVQEETTKLSLELQKQSDNFVKNIVKMDDELNTLLAQFEGETLTNLINDLNTELLTTCDTELQLQKNYAELKNSENELTGYERQSALNDIIWDAPEAKKLEEVEKKIADKKKNIQFLASEYTKKMDLLQKSYKSKN